MFKNSPIIIPEIKVFILCALILSWPQKNVSAQSAPLIPETSTPKPIVMDEPTEPLEERLARKITLDVREMSVIDVIKFLALKGEFNVVTNSNVQGRATFYLKSVSIQDALDIAVLSNRLAYIIENDIVRIMTDAEYETTLGKKFKDRHTVEIVQLQYAKPSYILSTLDNIKSSLGRIIIDEDTGSVVLIDTEESIEEMKKAIKSMESTLDTIVYSLQYAKADVIDSQLKARIDANGVGKTSIDERTNKVIVRAFPERRKEIEQLIASLDEPTKEVLIEVRVLEIIFKPQADYGIDWNLDFRKSKSQALKRMEFNNLFGTTSGNLGSTKYASFDVGDFSINQFDLEIKALSQVSDTRILSNPTLLVTNNEEARIHVGDTVPYIVSTTSGTGDNAITSEDVRFVDVGLSLHVVPAINDDGFITMGLKPEISTVSATINSEGGGIPQVTKTTVETTVMVQDGRTVVLGGLKKENKVKSAVGFPFLMHIPYLRKLFSSTAEAITSTEIVIFITPHIISGTEVHNQYRGVMKPVQDIGEKDTVAPGKPLAEAGKNRNKAALKIKD